MNTEIVQTNLIAESTQAIRLGLGYLRRYGANLASAGLLSLSVVAPVDLAASSSTKLDCTRKFFNQKMHPTKEDLIDYNACPYQLLGDPQPISPARLAQKAA